MQQAVTTADAGEKRAGRPIAFPWCRVPIMTMLVLLLLLTERRYRTKESQRSDTTTQDESRIARSQSTTNETQGLQLHLRAPSNNTWAIITIEYIYSLQSFLLSFPLMPVLLVLGCCWRHSSDDAT